MPTDPFELVRRWFQAFNAGDLDGLAALYHDDASNDSGATIARGRDAVREEIAHEQAPNDTTEEEPECEEPRQQVSGEVLRIWQACSTYLAGELSRADYDTWVRSCQPYEYDAQGNTFRVGVANAYARDWLNSRVSRLLSNYVIGLLGKSVQVVFDLNWDCMQSR